MKLSENDYIFKPGISGVLSKANELDIESCFKNYDTFTFKTDEELELLSESLNDITFKLSEEDYYRFLSDLWNNPAITKFILSFHKYKYVFKQTTLKSFSLKNSSESNGEYINHTPIVDCYVYFVSDVIKNSSAFKQPLVTLTLYSEEHIVDNKHESIMRVSIVNRNQNIPESIIDNDAIEAIKRLSYTFYTIVQYFMRNRPMVYTEKQEYIQNHSVKRNNHGKKKSVSNKVKVIRHYTINTEETEIIKSEHSHHTITCSSWGVAGHYRHYKNGNVVWIKPYTKGKDRENYTGKEYIL